MSSAARLHALDALRAVAMLLVIVGHALLSYSDMPYDALWVVRAPAAERSAFLSTLFWWLHGFRLPLYFVLAGFFAERLSVTRGANGFLRHRVKRILGPFLVGSVVLIPICFYAFAVGWWSAGECTWNEIRRVKFATPIQAELWGPIHLWFLEYLFLYAVLFWAWQMLLPARRPRTGGWSAAPLSSWWRPLWCALPTALVIWIHPAVVTAHHNRFIPEPFEFLHYGIYFVWGVYFHRHDATMASFVSGSWRCLTASLAMFALVEPLLRRYFAGTLTSGGRLSLAIALAFFAWLSIYAFLGLVQVFCARQRPALQYLADAAYWIYLIHLPLVVVLQVLVTRLPMPVVVKCAIVVAGAGAVCLWSYERWVRYSILGVVLHGARAQPTLAVAPAARPPGGEPMLGLKSGR